MILQRLVAGRHDLMPAAYLDRIGSIRGVSGKQGRLWGYFYDPAVRANYTLMVPGDGRGEPAPAAGEITIGAGIARARGLGDRRLAEPALRGGRALLVSGRRAARG